MSTVVVTQSSKIGATPIPLTKHTGLFIWPVGFYALGTGLALLPVMNDGNWRDALLRFGLVTISILIYFGLVSLLRWRPTWLTFLAIGLITVVAAIAILGTAAVDTSGFRMSGFNYRVYSFLRSILPVSHLPSVNQNVLGGFLATFLPLAVGLVLWNRVRWLQVYAGGCALVILGALVVTASRGALLGLAGAACGLGWFWLAGRSDSLRRVLQPALLGLLALLSVGGLVIFGGDSSGVNRLALWRSTLTMLSDYPLTGAGLDQFKYRIDDYASPYIYGQSQPHAHNLFLQSLAEFGLFGLVAIVLLAIITLRLLFRYANLGELAPAVRPVVAGSLAGLLALFLNGMVEYGSWGGWFAPFFWVLPALLAGVGLTLPGWQWPASLKQPKVKLASGLLALVLLLVIGLPLLLINVATIAGTNSASSSLYGVASTLAPWNSAPERALGRLATNPTEAQTHYLSAVQRDNNDWLSLIALGQLANAAGNQSQALAYWQQAQATPYFEELAQVALAKTPPDYATAEQHWQTALALQPNDPVAEQGLVQVYTATGRQQEASTLLQELIQTQPTPALLKQAAALATDPAAQTALLQKAINLDPNDAELYWELGNSYVSQQNLSANAEQAYQQALTIQPGFQWPIRSLAQLYMQQGRYNDSLQLLQDFLAKQLFPEKPDPEYVLLAQTQLALHNYAAALTAAQEALKYNGNNANAYLAKGDALVGSSDVSGAKAAYQQVLQLDPNNAAAKTKLTALP